MSSVLYQCTLVLFHISVLASDIEDTSCSISYIVYARRNIPIHLVQDMDVLTS
jgi:hypothetical protein